MTTYDDPQKLLQAHAASRIVFANYDRSKRLLVDPKREQWKEGYKAYRMAFDLKDNSQKTTIADSLIFTNVEDFLPRLVAQNPRIEVWPRTKSPQDEIRAAQHRALLFYDWDKLGMIFRTMEFVKSAEIFGTAVFKCLYRKEVQQRGIPVMMQPSFEGAPLGKPQREIVKRPVAIWNDPWVDICEIDEVYPDPDGKSIEDCGWVIHRFVRDLSEIKAAKKQNQPLYDEKVVAELEKRIKEGGNPLSHATEHESITEMRKTTFDDSEVPIADPHKRQVHLLEMWSRNKIVTVVEEMRDLAPIRNEWNELGEIPFVRYTPIPDINAFHGLSLPELLFAHGVELSALRSARIDNLRYAAAHMWTILEGSKINWKKVRFRAGGAIPLRDHDDIRPLEMSRTGLQGLYREADDIRRSAQQIGATDTFSGIASDQTGRTATEASILAEASGSRASLMFRILGEQALTPLGRLLIRNNELYLDETRYQRIASEEIAQFPFSKPLYETITPDGLITGSGTDLDVTIDIASVEPGNREVRLNKAERGLQVMGSFLPPDHPFMLEMLKLWGEGMGMEQPERLLFSSKSAQSFANQQAAENGTEPDDTQNLGDRLAADLGGVANA